MHTVIQDTHTEEALCHTGTTLVQVVYIRVRAASPVRPLEPRQVSCNDFFFNNNDSSL